MCSQFSQFLLRSSRGWMSAGWNYCFHFQFPFALGEERVREKKTQKELSVSEHCVQLELRVLSCESPRSRHLTLRPLQSCALLMHANPYVLSHVHENVFPGNYTWWLCLAQLKRTTLICIWHFVWGVCLHMFALFYWLFTRPYLFNWYVTQGQSRCFLYNEQFFCNQTAINVIASALKIVRSQRLYLE